MAPGSFGETQHLRADADAAFIEGLDGDLVALAALAQQVFLSNKTVVKEQFAGA